MANQFGPWATAIQIGSHPQLSTFWKRRMNMLIPVSQASPILSRRNFFWLGAAGVVTSMLPTVRFAAAMADEEKRHVLIYEIDPQSVPAGRPAPEMDRVLQVVDRRLNSASEKLAQVRKLNDRQIEVTLLRQNDADRERVERQVARTGTLEFRIIANPHDHKRIIELGRAEPLSTKTVKDSEGNVLGWWVPVQAAQERSFAADITRAIKHDDKTTLEVLVASDPHNVTGAYLVRVEREADQTGRPALGFTFNNTGGKLFGQLTGENLPDTVQNFHRRLGIILDGELYSAPHINSTISDRGIIQGHFTKEEVSDLANAMNAGSLSVRLRRVRKSSTAE
jgi:SecD/SecF fusion protein